MYGMHQCLSSLHERLDDFDEATKKKIIKVSGVIVGLVVIHKTCIYTYKYVGDRRLRDRKLNQIQTTKGKLLQKLVGLKQPIENRDILTNISYNELRDRINSNDLKTVEILEAYQAKALEVDRSLNCITDVIYDADVTAIYLDSLPSEKRGRLHGIPLSVKDCVCVADYDSYFGCISRCFKPEKYSALVVEALVNEGMIPFARTNMSQGGSSVACDNPLFGETLNPHDLKRTSGGSSGGEGALISSKGSIVGIGNDVGGSIRIPSSHCGIYGLKPTSERTGDEQHMSKWKHDLAPISYTVTCGPMSSDFDLLVDVTKVLFSSALFDLDENVPRLPFDTNVYESSAPMKIGMYKSFPDDACLEVVPSIKRGLDLARAALESRGHTVVEWEPPRMQYACSLLIRCLTVDGGDIFKQLQKEEFSLSKAMKTNCFFATLPSVCKVFMAGMLWFSSPMMTRYFLASTGAKSTKEVLQLMNEAKSYKEDFSKSWSEAGIDAVICPVVPFTAPLLGDTDYIQSGLLYSNLYNFLDYPAGVVPVSKVTDDDIQRLHSSYPRKNIIDRLVIKTQAESKGVPVSVQCVAKRWQDEKAIRLMKEIVLGLSNI